MDNGRRGAIRLYDRETSGNAYKVRLLLSFLKVPFESVPVRLKNGRNEIDEAYLRLNPRGQIPTLQDGLTVLWGSTAILVYLALRYDPTRQWLPASASAVAEVMQWLELAQNEISTGLFKARAILRFNYDGNLVLAQSEGRRALTILERTLAQHAWLTGNSPTIADIACFPYVALAHEGRLDIEPYEAIGRWQSRFKSLDGFIAMPGIEAAS